MSAKQYLIVVELLPTGVLQAVRRLSKDPAWSNLEVVVLTSKASDAKKIVDSFKAQFSVNIWPCDFNNETQLKKLIDPIKKDVVGVLCRGDKQIQQLRKLVPLLPPKVRVASARSLKIATNKRLMRAAFLESSPEITPRFVRVKDGTEQTLDLVEREVKFPVIIKPAGLASSLLIQACRDRGELEKGLKKVFEQIVEIYKREDREESPEVIVEQYLEGDFYSIDAYVLDPDDIYCCPAIAYLPAKKLGIDDFFLFKRWAPSRLSKTLALQAYETTKLAIMATGLTYSTAHVELVLTLEGWKVIEIGPRMGRFRNTMYRLAYGIDHSFNDLSVHLGLKPVINSKLINYCAAYSVYPRSEGILKAIKGLEKILAHPDCKWRKIDFKINKQVYFAKNGGHSIAEFILADPSAQQFKELTEYADHHVLAEVL